MTSDEYCREKCNQTAKRRREQCLNVNHSPAQIERHRLLNRTESLTPERILSRGSLLAESGKRRKLFLNSLKVEVEQIWDEDKPCIHCECLFLKSTPNTSRKLCCQGGKYVGPQSLLPPLHPLPPKLRHIATMTLNHFSKSCSFYNKIFSLASTMPNHGTGRQQRPGNHSFTLNGNVSHALPVATSQMKCLVGCHILHSMDKLTE